MLERRTSDVPGMLVRPNSDRQRRHGVAGALRIAPAGRPRGASGADREQISEVLQVVGIVPFDTDELAHAAAAPSISSWITSAAVAIRVTWATDVPA